ncbi:MAG: sulfotransferase [Candidatus Electrothrix sp. AUS1_2]|nr:sulfotransferase [Candidatus Electrothrix sp. AUS1_2]
MSNQLPHFFVVGAQKAGTTYLHNILVEDTRFFLPRIKETHFFSDNNHEFNNGIEFYLEKYFSQAPCCAIKGEVDPEYLYFQKSAERIAQLIPKAKLIFLFRKPAERAFSHYCMTYRRGIETLSFQDALANEYRRIRNGSIQVKSNYSYRDRGLYGKQVQNYLNYFSIEQMLFLDSEELWNNPTTTVQKVYNFLNINYKGGEKEKDIDKNTGGMPKNLFIQRFMAGSSFIKKAGKILLPQSVRTQIRQYLEKNNRHSGIYFEIEEKKIIELREFYKNDVQLLSDLTGRDFGHLISG